MTNGIHLRQAGPADLSDLQRIEIACFPVARRSRRPALRRSLQSRRQTVWLAEVSTTQGLRAMGALVLWTYPLTVRIYSIGVLPEVRGQGVGHLLMAHAVREAKRMGRKFLSLEADAKDVVLVAWYRRYGFVETQRLRDYYGPRRHAIRMRSHVYT